MSISESYVKRAQKTLLVLPGNSIVFNRGDGVYLYDEDGKRYLDATARSGVVSFGHNNPIIQEVDAKMAELGTQFFQTIGDHWRVKIKVQGTEYEISPAALAETLIAMTYGTKEAFVIPKETGATANNSIVKLISKLRPDRRVFASFGGGYHGRSGYADALTDTKPLHKSYYPASMSVRFLPFIETEHDLRTAREAMLRSGFENLNTAFFEGVQSEGGMRSQNPDLLRSLLLEMQKQGGFIHSDEIFAGFYRTGKRFAYEHYGVVPDSIAMAKALGQGAPASAIILSKRIFDEAGISPEKACPKAWEGGTFTWTPVAVARAIVTMTHYDKVGIGEHVQKMAKHFETRVSNGLLKLKDANSKQLLHLTGLGLMRGIRFGDLFTPYPGLRDETRRQLAANGISISGVGNDTINPTIRFTPPLTIEQNQVDEFCDALEISIKKAIEKVGII